MPGRRGRQRGHAPLAGVIGRLARRDPGDDAATEKPMWCRMRAL